MEKYIGLEGYKPVDEVADVEPISIGEETELVLFQVPP
jgi:hypothetical protein